MKSFKTPKERQLLLFKDTRGSTGVNDYKSRKHEKAKKAAEKGIGKESTFDMSFIEKEKTSYTMEENFHAYRLFCLMDVDNSGFISLRELRRVLTGHSANNALVVEFPHPDVGIVWNLDQDDCVCIEHIEDKSPASLQRELINGLILMRINETIIPPYESYSLQLLHNELIRIHDQPIELEFVEPLFIINKFTTSLDLEVYGVIYTAWLPVGAVNNFSTMEKNIHNALIEAHPALTVINIRIDRKSKRVTLSCDEYPFRLMFATGPNFQVSCRYCLGFTALDYEESFEHIGEVLVVDLDLKLPDDKIDILMEELFGTFDRDGSGEFQFEEFRDFYTKLLANDQCLQTLRDYAHYRFRNKLIEKRKNEIYEQRQQKARRRKMLKEKEGKLMAAQRQKRLENQVLCYDGVVRKKVDHRREDQIMKKVNKASTATVLEPLGMSHDDQIKNIEKAEKISRMLTRQQTRKIHKEQELQRKEKLLEVMKTNTETEKSLKKSQHDVQQKGNKLHMSEMLQILKGAYMRGFNSYETGVHGIQALSLNQNVVLSPGLKIGMNLFTDRASVDDIDIEDVDSKRMHPSALRYFFMRERMGDKFDSSKRHPCFFGADYTRDDSRHSSMGLGVCRAILSQRNSYKISSTLSSELDSQIDFMREDVKDLLMEMIDLLEAATSTSIDFVNKLFGSSTSDDQVSQETSNILGIESLDDVASDDEAGVDEFPVEDGDDDVEAEAENDGDDGDDCNPESFMNESESNLEITNQEIENEDENISLHNSEEDIPDKDVKTMNDIQSYDNSHHSFHSVLTESEKQSLDNSSHEDDDDDDDSEEDDDDESEEEEEEEEDKFTSFPDLNSYLYQQCHDSLDNQTQLVMNLLENFLTSNPIPSSLDEIISSMASSSVNIILENITKNLTQLILSYHSKGITPSSPSPPLLKHTLSSSSTSFRKREGIMYKRASFEGSGRLLISGGESGNYLIETDTEQFNLTKVESKVIGICLYDIILFHRHTSSDPTSTSINQELSQNLSNCTVSVSVTYNHTQRILHYPSDNYYQKRFHERISRRKYQISGNQLRLFNQKNWIYECIWSKLYLKDDKWRKIEIRNYQKISFQFFTAASSSSNQKEILLGEILIPFQDLLKSYEKELKSQQNQLKDPNFQFSSSCPFIYSTPFTIRIPSPSSSSSSSSSLPIQCDLSMNIDTDLICDYNRIQRKSLDYWNQKRSQHWTVYPNFPINTGIVRQKYRDIARLYDKQQIIHPSVVGFCIRYKGHPSDEVHFIHPMFHDFSLVKKPLPRIVLDEIRRQAQLGNKTNPFKYKPMKECPICYDHQPGCPRCWNMPSLPNGDPMRPIDFQFDPDLEQREKADKELKQHKREQTKKMKNDAKRALLAAGRSFMENDEEEDEESIESSQSLIRISSERPKLHTRLTTEKGLQLYRNIILRILTVYVKIMPGHDVIRVQLDPDDTIWHLHNMFKTHHPLGNLRGSMLILPTSNGLYHMDADMIPENEFMKERRTALIKLSDYGFIRRNSQLVTIYLPYYKDDTLIPIMKKYIKENLFIPNDEINFNIPTVLHNKTIPNNLESDSIQSSLLQVVIRNYHEQQIHIKAKYQIMGRKHQEEMKRLADEKQKLLLEKRLEEDRLRIQEEKEISKRLKGLTGDELIKAKEEIYQERQARIMESGTSAEKRVIERVMKAADRHMKLAEKRQTRLTPNIEVDEESSASASSSSSPQPGQLQFLMSSSSTPQLPSIAENNSHQSSSTLSQPIRRVSNDQQDSITEMKKEEEKEEKEEDDNVSWGIPIVQATQGDASTLSKEDSQANSTMKSGSKKKKKQARFHDNNHDHDNHHHPTHDHNEKIMLPSAMVDAPFSSISGASSLSVPSSSIEEKVHNTDNTPTSSSQLPPIRNRLQDITRFFSFTKK